MGNAQLAQFAHFMSFIAAFTQAMREHGIEAVRAAALLDGAFNIKSLSVALAEPKGSDKYGE